MFTSSETHNITAGGKFLPPTDSPPKPKKILPGKSLENQLRYRTRAARCRSPLVYMSPDLYHVLAPSEARLDLTC